MLSSMMQDRSESSGSRPWSGLSTEARHPASMDLDTLDSESIVTLLLREDRRGLESAREQSVAVALAAGWLAEAIAADGRVVFVGAGTSGRLGVLEAAECPPTFGSDPETIQAAIAGGPDAVFRATEGAEDDVEAGRAIGFSLKAGDLVIGISASSVTPYVLGALSGAKSKLVKTVLISCAPRERVESSADLVICLDTGPEILTGSTRLKAGSATKAVLNALTTTAMVRLGKVFENMMVDLRCGSAKLRDRAERIVCCLVSVDPMEARQLLEEAGGDVKVAVLKGRLSVSTETARAALQAANGDLRSALSATAE